MQSVPVMALIPHVMKLASFIALLATAVLAEPLQIQLVSEVKSIAPGQPFYVGLSLHHGEGYHTYWKHPGIVGVPTNIKWEQFPEGFKAEPIDWPKPQPVRMFQIKAQGYERDVVLPIRITPPTSLKPGETITLRGKASWMCCARECNPGFKDLSIALPVAEKAVVDAKWHKKFEAERAIRPRTSEAWSAKVSNKDKHWSLTLSPGAKARPLSKAEAEKLIFFTEDGIIDSDKPQKIELRGNGEVVFELVEADYILGDRPTTLSGVILRGGDWVEGASWDCLRIRAPMK